MGAWARPVLLALLPLLAPRHAGAAEVTTGTLSGEVADGATGRPVAGALVSATGVVLGEARATLTGGDGRFTLAGLPPGEYRLEAVAEGYQAASRAGLAVRANGTLRASLALTPDTVRLEELVVTGSRIPRQELVSPAPLVIVTREQLERGGKILVADVLQALPVQANGTNANFNNGGDGSIRASLRGLGEARTLVLVNGRRYVAGGLGANDSVDLGSLPSAAVERIEILLDGASPVYGSEAIGGVINVITRRRWEGTEVSAYGGASSRGDGGAVDLSLTTGVASERGSLMLSLGYGARRQVWAGDRAWSAYDWELDPTGANNPLGTPGRYAAGSSATPAGRIRAIAGSGKPLPNPTGDAEIDLYNQLVLTYPTALFFVPDAQAPLGWRPWAGDALPEYGGDQYNYQPANYLVTPSQRLSLFSTGDLKLGSHARAFLEVTAVNRQSRQKLAPEPISIYPAGIVLSAGNQFNPFGADILRANGRMMGLGNRAMAQDVDALRLLGGLDGALPAAAGPLEGWRWELSGNLGRTQAIEAYTGFVRGSALRSALGPSTNYGTTERPDWGCGTGPDDRVAGCVPIDLFGAGGALTPEQAAFLSTDGTSRGTNALTGALATLTGALPKPWPGPKLGLALGLEYRKVSGTQVPDALFAVGDTARGDKIYETSGAQDVREAFLEVSVPILERLPLAEVLEAQLAARVFRYSGFGTDWTWKVGARWKPVHDLTLRGTLSTAFRAPNIWELHYGAASGQAEVTDPCAGIDETGAPAPVSPWCGSAAGNGNQLPLVTMEDHGNPALQPETARVFTAGVVLEPRFLDGLSVTWDAYGVDIDHVIQYSGVNPIDTCYPMQADVTPLFCDQVRRDPATQALTRLVVTPLNVGSERMRGFDLAIRYGMKTGLGRFDLSWEGTWLERYDLVRGDGSTIHARGNLDLPRGLSWAMPTVRFNAGAAWRREGASGALDVRYLGPLTECATADGNFGSAYCSFEHAYERRVSDYASWTAEVGYRFETSAGTTQLLLGVQNLLDSRPPTIYTAWFPADPSYDFVGRYFYGRLVHRL